MSVMRCENLSLIQCIGASEILGSYGVTCSSPYRRKRLNPFLAVKAVIAHLPADGPKSHFFW
jgi:hypothetical protein